MRVCLYSVRYIQESFFCNEKIHLYCLLSLIFAACSNGTFGVDCELTCGHCYVNSACDHVNGSCASGCASGWAGTVCNESEMIRFSFL